MLKTITLTGTFPEEDIEAYAQANGWQPGGEQTAIQFAQQRLLNLVIADITIVTQNAINQQIEEQRTQAYAQLQERVGQALSIVVEDTTVDEPTE